MYHSYTGEKLLQVYHDSLLNGGHFGETITINELVPLYYWPSMSTTIKKFVQHCFQFQLMKRYEPANNSLLESLPIAAGRWLDISIDFVTGLPPTKRGFDMILVVVDRFSKRAHFIATNKKCTTAHTVQLLYRYIFCYHGFPRTTVLDRGIRFVTSAYRELTEHLGIKLLMSCSNHPETDGRTANKTLGRLLRSFCFSDSDQWDRFLPHIEYVYNSTPQTSTGNAPFEI